MFTGDYCGGMGPAGWLLMIGFWAAIIAVIVWAVTRLFPQESTGGRSPAVMQQRQDPQELLDQRPASDEIDPQTYCPAGTHGHRSGGRARDHRSCNNRGPDLPVPVTPAWSRCPEPLSPRQPGSHCVFSDRGSRADAR